MNNVNYSDLKLKVAELCRQEKFPPSREGSNFGKGTHFSLLMCYFQPKTPKLQLELFAITCIAEHNMG